MSAGMVIEVRRSEEWNRQANVPVDREEDLQARYDRLAQQVLRLGSWLQGTRAQLLPDDEWAARFEEYQDQLQQLRQLGDLLRPVTLRSRDEFLTGEALTHEVLELFAA